MKMGPFTIEAEGGRTTTDGSTVSGKFGKEIEKVVGSKVWAKLESMSVIYMCECVDVDIGSMEEIERALEVIRVMMEDLEKEKQRAEEE